MIPRDRASTMLRPTRAASMDAHTRISMMPASLPARHATGSGAVIGLAYVCLLAACAASGATLQAHA